MQQPQDQNGECIKELDSVIGANFFYALNYSLLLE